METKRNKESEKEKKRARINKDVKGSLWYNKRNVKRKTERDAVRLSTNFFISCCHQTGKKWWHCY